MIKGAGAYIANVTETALGTIRSVEHTIHHLDETAANLAQNLADTRKRLADTKVQVEAPFEYAERLASLVRRQQEIEDELDLTKSHVPGGLDGKPDEASPENGAPGSPEPEVPDLG
jgi:ABC-type transporter Mla subunit MlaD